jgi:copper(I)-binding protein
VSTLRRPTPDLRLPAAGAVLVLALTGCGATLDAQTYQERSQADATNTAVGTIALRGVSVESGGEDRLLEEGEDAEVFLVLTNDDDEDDTLVEVTSSDAEEVELLVDGEPSPDGIEVPRLGTTGDSAGLELVSLTEELREGEYTTLTFRFERNGTVEVPVPVRASGRTDRPVYTGGEGEEGEPALQAPAGGEEGEEAGGDEDGAGGEGEEGTVGEAEPGQGEDEGETAPRDEEETTNETDEEDPAASPSPSG